MKVLVFTTLYPNNIWPNHGVFIKERMTQFAKQHGCEIRVIAPVPYFPAININWRSKFSQVARREIKEGVNVYHPRYFMTPKVGMVFYGCLMFVSVLRTVSRIQKEFKFDLIDAHYVYPDGMAAVFLGWIFQKPVVISARGSDINQYVQLPLIRRLLEFTLRRADKVISVCIALKQAMTELGVSAEKIQVVSNGVDVAKFYPISRETARKQLCIPLEKKIAISVGSLIPRKGFDLLLKAVKALTIEPGLEDLNLIIIGEGPCRKELEKLIASLNLVNRVRLVGAVPHEELRSWYSAADLSCLTSTYEGWPNVILESMACGVPVVATNTWGVPEIVTSDKVGILTEPREDAIAEAIRVALTKQWRTEDLLEHAGNHSWDRTALGVLHVFQSVVKEDQVLPSNCSAERIKNDKTAEHNGVNT